jgi:hypothetical protein
MPQPTLGDVHVNRPLTNMSVGFLQDPSDYVASGPSPVFPGIPVPSKSDVYFKYARDDFFRNQMALRAPGDPAAGGGYKLATGTYTAQVWALLKKVDDQIRANSDSPLSPDRDAVAYLTQQAQINKEVNWCSAYFGTGIWGYEKAGQAASDATHVKFWDTGGSDPVADVLAARKAVKKATGYYPNKLILGEEVSTALQTNASIIDRIKYGQTGPGPAEVNDAALASLFKIKEVRTTAAIQTTSVEDLNNDSDTLPATFDFIGGKHALLVYAAPTPGIMTPSAGYTFNWTGFTGASAAGTRIKKYRWEVNSADHVEIDSAYAFALVSKYLGAMLLGVTQ